MNDAEQELDQFLQHGSDPTTGAAARRRCSYSPTSRGSGSAGERRDSSASATPWVSHRQAGCHREGRGGRDVAERDREREEEQREGREAADHATQQADHLAGSPLDVGERGQHGRDDRERRQQPAQLRAQRTGRRRQAQHERERAAGPHGQVPARVGGQRVARQRCPRQEQQPGGECRQRQREGELDGDVQAAEHGGEADEHEPPDEHAGSPPDAVGEVRVDHHEGDQRHQPEQRPGGRVGGEAAAVGEGVGEQDRTRDHRQPGDQATDPRAEAPGGHRGAHDEARREQHLHRDQRHVPMMMAHREGGATASRVRRRAAGPCGSPSPRRAPRGRGSARSSDRAVR